MNHSKNEELCCICGGPIAGYDNNAEPLKSGRCCDICNGRVIGARLAPIVGHDVATELGKRLQKLISERGRLGAAQSK